MLNRVAERIKVRRKRRTIVAIQLAHKKIPS